MAKQPHWSTTEEAVRFFAEQEANAAPPDRIALFAQRSGLSQGKLAELLGVSRQWVNLLVNGKVAITAAVAERLSDISGKPMAYWLEGQEQEGAVALVPQATGETAARRIATSLPGRARILVDTELQAFLSQDVVAPFDHERVQPASYDLTVGDQADIIGWGMVDLSERPAMLASGRTATITCRERIKLPRTHLARLGPISELPREGIFVSVGLQVDPGFEGQLVISLHNHGETAYELKMGRPILSMEFHCLGRETGQVYDGPYQKAGLPARPPEAPAQSGDYIRSGRFRRETLNRFGLVLTAPLEGEIEQVDGRYVIALPNLSGTAVGRTEADAVDKLVGLICARYDMLKRADALGGPRNAEYDWLRTIVQPRNFISVADVRGLADRLGAEAEQFGSFFVATVARDGRAVAQLMIPESGEMHVRDIASSLGLGEEQCFRLLAGEATAADYFRWRGVSR